MVVGINGSCRCAKSNPSQNILKCCKYDRSVTLLACYCLSHYPELNRTVVGNCIYSCSLSYYHKIRALGQSCERFNRQGELCGECKPGLGHPVYSYSPTCVNCTQHSAGVVTYLTMAYLPMTAFYVLVVVFRVSVTSERLAGYVLACQIMTMPAQVRYIATLELEKSSKDAANTMMALHSIWNLDFFKSYYTPFCFDTHLGSLIVISLEYAVALYPLFLIFATYILVRMHDKFLVVSKVWKPIELLCAKMRKTWKIRKSLVDSFATFLLLSYIKILNASFNLLIPTRLMDLNGTTTNLEYLYYDGSVRIFYGHHTKFAVLAIIMSTIFNFLPLLLLFLYPTQLFQSLLNRCDRSRFQLMHTFMDSFQGCYRLSPLDCRYFAAIHLLVRILNLTIFSITLTRYYFLFTSIIFIILAMMTITLRPYRLPRQNTVDATFYLAVATGYLGAAGYALSPEKLYNRTFVVLMVCTCVATTIYTLILLPGLLIIKPFYGRLRSIVLTRRRNLVEIDEELFNSMSRGDETAALLKPDAGGEQANYSINGFQQETNK